MRIRFDADESFPMKTPKPSSDVIYGTRLKLPRTRTNINATKWTIKPLIKSLQNMNLQLILIIVQFNLNIKLFLLLYLCAFSAKRRWKQRIILRAFTLYCSFWIYFQISSGKSVGKVQIFFRFSCFQKKAPSQGDVNYGSAKSHQKKKKKRKKAKRENIWGNCQSQDYGSMSAYHFALWHLSR